MISKEAWFAIIAVRPIRLAPGEVKRAAEELWDQFEEWIETNSGVISPGDLWNPNMGYPVKVETVKGEKIRVPLVATAIPANGTLTLQGYLRLSTPKYLGVVFPIAGVRVEDARSRLPTVKRFWKEQVESIVSHELTHAKDFIKQLTYDDPASDYRKYINDPNEVRAYMQQVALEVANYFSSAAGQSLRGNLSSSLEKALQSSPTWKDRIEPYASEENRRTIITGVVNYLNDRGLL